MKSKGYKIKVIPQLSPLMSQTTLVIDISLTDATQMKLHYNLFTQHGKCMYLHLVT